MEMRIKIPEKIYDAITKENQISFDELHELFDSIRNGIAADEPLNVKEKKISDHAEVCHLMTVYLGRNFDPHEAQIIALYKTIADNKETLAGLSGPEKLFVKMLIRSLVS